MAQQLANIGNRAASGQVNMSATALAEIKYANMILGQAWEGFPFAQFVLNSEEIGEAMTSALVHFDLEPDTHEWRKVENGRNYRYEQVEFDGFNLVIDQVYDKAIIFNKLDLLTAQGPRLDAMMAATKRNMMKQLAPLWASYISGGWIGGVEKHNQGAKAGRFHTINLGTDTQPIVLTPNNVYSVMNMMVTVMQQANRWQDQDGEQLNFGWIMSKNVAACLRQSYQYSLVNHGGQQAEGILYNGKLPPSILGAHILSTNYLPVKRGLAAANTQLPTEYLLLVWDSAFAFRGALVEAVDGALAVEKRAYGILATEKHGGRPFFPDAIVMARVQCDLTQQIN